MANQSIPASPMRLQDPFLQRELESYSNPLPSREFILQILAEKKAPISLHELSDLLGIQADESLFFTRRLRAMVREGQLTIDSKTEMLAVAPEQVLAEGIVLAHRDGFGFVRLQDGTADIFLGEREMKKVLHGDQVIVRDVGADRRGRREGRIARILKRANFRVVGRAHLHEGEWLFVPEDRRLAQSFVVDLDASDAAPEEGAVVVVEIVTQPNGYTLPICRIVEVVGYESDPGIEIEIALRKHELPSVFPEQVLAETAELPSQILKKTLKKRKDLRHIPFVTIDSEGAKDFDDAVFAEKKGRGWRLMVAIADVSAYVKPQTALDEEALLRGTSVYFPRRVIPMLPEALSNGLCSLMPNVDRLGLICEMRIGAKGRVKGYKFYPAVICSQARLTYTGVSRALAGNEAAVENELMPHIQNLYGVFRVLLAQRALRGAVEFVSHEMRMVFDSQGRIKKVVPIARNDAHRLIEECMLAANVCAADFLLKEKRSVGLFRVHECPSVEKLKSLRSYLSVVGLHLGGGDKPTPKDYGVLLEEVAGRADEDVIHLMLLRSMQQAVYSANNQGHFGLAYEAYTHFTSPIRRYPDLLTHRAIKAILKGREYVSALNWEQLGVHCSMTERRADEASRDVESWLKCVFMEKYLGHVFTGRVNSIASFGMFVLLEGVQIEGLLHIADLGKDYFRYDRSSHSLIAEKTGVVHRLGDVLTVKVVRVDKENAQIELLFVSQDDASVKAESVH